MRRHFDLRLIALLVFLVVAAVGSTKVLETLIARYSPDPAALIPIVDPTPKPYQQTYGPVFAAERPPGPFERVDGAMLSHDRQTLWVGFVGGSTYDRSSPCGEDHAGWAGFEGADLVFAVYTIDHPEQATFGPNEACVDVGHSYLFELRLPGPFRGLTVRDLNPNRAWVPIPERIAEIAALPAGWRVCDLATYAATGPGTGVLARTWCPPAGALPNRGDFVALSQVFGGPPDQVLLNKIDTITIRGLTVDVEENGPGGLRAAWEFAGAGFVLATFSPDLDVAALERLANSIAIPNR